MIVLSSFRARLDVTERELTVEALTTTHGCVKAAARLCGLHPWQMHRIIKRHALGSLVATHRARGGNDAWRALGEV